MSVFVVCMFSYLANRFLSEHLIHHHSAVQLAVCSVLRLQLLSVALTKHIDNFWL